MAVRIGSARSSFGSPQPGDQHGGKEVSIQDWYLHSKGWEVYRAKDAEKREDIAVAMERACANNSIGYHQPTRNTLYNEVKHKGFDPALTSKAVNTDCSALVRVCCNYAGITVGDFITSNEGEKLMATGEFEKFTDSDHCKSSKHLLRGDILCTKTKGHTVVVLDDGAEASKERPEVIVPAASSNSVRVTGNTVNVRKGPGKSYKSIGNAKKGEVLEKFAVTNGWVQVRWKNQIAYISALYVEDVAVQKSEEVKAVVDISKWNGAIDFDVLKEHVSLVIVRASSGTNKDVVLDYNANEMRRCGIPFGVYGYSYADSIDEAREEARKLVEYAAPHKPLFYVLDAEEKRLNNEIITVWADEMRRLGVEKLGCYVAHNRYKGYWFDSLRSLFDFVWIPRYGKNTGKIVDSIKPDFACDLWQYTSVGKVEGINHNTDMNVLTGSKPLAWFLGKE